MENGKSAIARGLTNGIGFGSTEFHVFRPGPKATAEWLHCLLRSRQLRDEAEVAMTGAAGQQRVPRDFLAAYGIPVPPLPEQKRLVARIEAQIGRVEHIRRSQKKSDGELRDLLAGYYAEIVDGVQWLPMAEVAPLVRRRVKLVFNCVN